MPAAFQFLADQPFISLFFVLGCGYLVGRVSIGFFSPGSTAGCLLVALALGGAAFALAGVRFQIPDVVGTIFLALFTYAIGLRVGPQFVDGLREEGWQLVTLVLVTTTVAFAIAYGGSVMLGLGPGYAPGILSGSNTISAVMGVATAAVDGGLYEMSATTTAAEVKANIAAGYSLTYIFSVLAIVLVVRNLPGLFGIDPVASARESEKRHGGGGHALPGTSQAFEIGTTPIETRMLPLLPELAAEGASHVDIDQAEIVVTDRRFVGSTLKDEHAAVADAGVRARGFFRDGHELPLLPATKLRRHDVLRVIGRPDGVRRLAAALGQAVRPTNATDIVTLGFGIATGYLVGLITVPIAGIPVGLGAMGGVVVAGMAVSIARAVNPAFGGPMPEGARAFLESIGVDLFVTSLGLNVAPALVTAFSDGMRTLLVVLLGIVCATVPTFVSWLVGLYLLKMEPMVLAGAVAGARNSTTAMRAISEKSKSTMPAFGYPVPYALSTVVFLVYGYLAMLLS
jgi:putative transport protein